MILHLVAGVFLLGLALLLGILNLIRTLYGCGIGEPLFSSTDPLDSDESVVHPPPAEQA
jgi:hypothetical protein